VGGENMDYVREAEKVLYHYRDLKFALENLNHQIGTIIRQSAPTDAKGARFEITGVKSGYQDDTYNSLFKLKVLTENQEKTAEEIKKIDSLLDAIEKDPDCEYYSQVLRLWYIEKTPKEEIAGLIGYSQNSRQSIYNIKDRAIRKFAIMYFGLEALKAI
jgi:hypothetical protein